MVLAVIGLYFLGSYFSSKAVNEIDQKLSAMANPVDKTAFFIESINHLLAQK